MEKNTDRQKRVCKADIWERYYLDDSNGKTFLNATASAKAAGYNCTTDKSFAEIGRRNRERIQDRLSAWRGEFGLTPDMVVDKIRQLMEAKKTEVYLHNGEVVLEREVDDRQVQVRAVHLAVKVLGMEAPSKHEHSGLDGKALEVTIKPDMPPELAEQKFNAMLLAINGSAS